MLGSVAAAPSAMPSSCLGSMQTARLRAEGVDASSGDNSVRLYTSPGVADVVLSTPVDAREGMGQRVKVTVESDGTIAHDTLAVRVI